MCLVCTLARKFRWPLRCYSISHLRIHGTTKHVIGISSEDVMSYRKQHSVTSITSTNSAIELRLSDSDQCSDRAHSPATPRLVQYRLLLTSPLAVRRRTASQPGSLTQTGLAPRHARASAAAHGRDGSARPTAKDATGTRLGRGASSWLGLGSSSWLGLGLDSRAADSALEL